MKEELKIIDQLLSYFHELGKTGDALQDLLEDHVYPEDTVNSIHKSMLKQNTYIKYAAKMDEAHTSFMGNLKVLSTSYLITQEDD